MALSDGEERERVGGEEEGGGVQRHNAVPNYKASSGREGRILWHCNVYQTLLLCCSSLQLLTAKRGGESWRATKGGNCVLRWLLPSWPPPSPPRSNHIKGSPRRHYYYYTAQACRECHAFFSPFCCPGGRERPSLLVQLPGEDKVDTAL